MRAVPSRLLPAAALGLALAAAPLAADAGPGARDRLTPHVVPAEICRGYFLVTLELGEPEGRTLLLLLDTGASHTVIDPESVYRVSGRRVAGDTRIRLRDAAAGPLRVNRLTARARQLDHISLALGRPIDGILGYDTFQDLLLTLDYPRRQVRVGKGRLPRPNGKDVFELEGRGRPFLPVQVEGRRERVLIDSGASSLLDLNAAPSWTWIQRPRPVGARMQIRGVTVRSAGRLSSDVLFGPAIVERPIVELTDGTQLVGSDLLRHFELTFEWTRRIRIRQAEPGPIESATPLGIGVGFEPGPEGLEVLQVFAGSPAEGAGVLVGDLVTAIDGVPVAERGCDPPIPEYTPRVTLSILRGEREMALDVPVVPLLPESVSTAGTP